MITLLFANGASNTAQFDWEKSRPEQVELNEHIFNRRVLRPGLVVYVERGVTVGTLAAWMEFNHPKKTDERVYVAPLYARETRQRDVFGLFKEERCGSCGDVVPDPGRGIRVLCDPCAKRMSL